MEQSNSMAASTTKPISIKLSYGKELRRFTCAPTFQNVKQEVGRILNLEHGNFHMYYVDEENDLITFNTDLELMEAIALNPNLLRLQIKKLVDGVKCNHHHNHNHNQNMVQSARVEVPHPPQVSAQLVQSLAASLPSPPAPSAPALVVSQPPLPLPPQQASSQQPPETLVVQNDSVQTVVGNKDWKSLKAEKDKLRLMKLRAKEERIAQKLKEKQERLQKKAQAAMKEDKPQGVVIRDYDARFIKHVTCDENTQMVPDSAFTKVWRFRNTGTKAWPATCKFQRVSRLDNPFSAPEFIPLGVEVAPDAEVDIVVNMVSPHVTGRFAAFWRLSTPEGKKFGQRVRVQIQVITDASSPSSSEESGSDEAVSLAVSSANNNNVDKQSVDPQSNEWVMVNSQLTSMGFLNVELNARLLKKFKGNVAKVVNALVRKQMKKSGLKGSGTAYYYN